MKVEFDIKCTVNIELDNKKYNNRNLSEDELRAILDDYLSSCEQTCEIELSKDGFFEDITVEDMRVIK